MSTQTSGSTAPSSSTEEPKHFDMKKWSSVAFWSWDIVVDNCAVCRNHIMDLCIECQANQIHGADNECTAAWGMFYTVHATMHSTFTASVDGCRTGQCVLWIMLNGSSESMAARSFRLLPLQLVE
ncbi:hypothetical protein Gogos_007451 [Gossypium gossypioides]|uniref:Zinc finger RING-H2-type domain-containing protein n=1 Tax=Gossypium gossypioides TaxID=34282 RepID=A0A7J9C8T8_GOSGO|nr:hypothetical protein [Gossypium gossypioides]